MSEQRLQAAVERLKESGVRITPQRHAVLEFLLNSKIHPTADDIYRALEDKFPNMSVATVYNNLRVFRENGLVRELTYGDSSSRFDCDTEEHYHLICDQCGKIVDFHYPSLYRSREARCPGYKLRCDPSSFGIIRDVPGLSANNQALTSADFFYR